MARIFLPSDDAQTEDNRIMSGRIRRERRPADWNIYWNMAQSVGY